EIVHTPREEGMLGADREADRIIAKIPGAISLKQFNNPANPKAHYETTGPEIYQQLDGQIDFFVAGAGSGGTFSGVVKYLKEQNSGIQGVLADPLGSIIGGGEHFDYDIEGIGNDFIADTMDITLVDQVIKISDSEAFDTARLLAKKEGILAGSSSGAALAAAIRLAKTLDHGNVVTIFPDRGDRYLSKGLFD
ncbi:MAG: pyridoxal-phosphate dependent enzyme, partial [Lachnospiraceae bacterium]|nr:pyridoxal-phosphate dependent enzyme [Lachnospiraceae bacterium]